MTAPPVSPGHTWRAGRVRPELASDYFQVDDRETRHVLSFATRFGRLLAFARADRAERPDHADGDPTDWGELFSRDVSFLLAEMSLADASRRYRDSRYAAPQDLAEEIADATATLADWRGRAGLLPNLGRDGSVETVLIETLRSAIDEELAPLLGKDGIEGLLASPALRARVEVQALLDRDANGPGELHSALSRTVDHLADFAREQLTRSPASKADHEPHAGLFLAFADVFAMARAELNTFTERHLDHYYQDWLGLHTAPPVPDRVHVHFTPAAGVPAFELPAATQLSAGQTPDGNEIVFATDAPRRVRQAKIVAVATLARAGGRFSQRLVGSDAGADAGPPPLRPFGDLAGTEPEFGLGLAHPLLVLAGGTRVITIHLAFRQDDASAVGIWLDLRSADFRLAVSTPEGFRDAGNLTLITATPTELVLRATVAASEPPIAPAAGAASEAPLARLVIRGAALVALSHLTVVKLKLRVDVHGLTGVKLSSPDGPLDPSRPFPPFGTQPIRQSWLELTHPELAAKHVDRLRIGLYWASIPADGYFANYASPPVERADFLVDVARDEMGTWLTETGALRLFPDPDPMRTELPIRVAPAAAGNGPISRLRVRLIAPGIGFGREVYPVAAARLAQAHMTNPRRARAQEVVALPLPFTPIAERVVLDYGAAATLDPGDGPEHGRVWSLHPFGQAVRERQPFALVAARDVPGTLFIGIATDAADEPLSMLVHLGDGGWTEWQARPAPDGTPPLSTRPCQLLWRYLTTEGWRTMPDAALLADGTDEFLRSGVVELQPPRDWAASAPHMPAGPRWLALEIRPPDDPSAAAVVPTAAAQAIATRPPVSESAAKALLAGFPELLGVYCNAVTATRRSPMPAGHPPRVDSGAVTAVTDFALQIAAVGQPFASEGGRARESKAEYRTRVSERLGHRGRAVFAVDCERLAIQHFPSIGDARCIATGPGRLVLIVAPVRTAATGPEPRLPSHLLRDIGVFLASRSSGWVDSLIVRTPAYEPVRVTVRVEFEPGQANPTRSRLDQAIADAIAPWRLDHDAPLAIGGTLHAARLATAMAAVEGVRAIRNLSLARFYRTPAHPEGGAADSVGASIEEPRFGIADTARWLRPDEARLGGSAPWSVLVPAASHRYLDQDDDTSRQGIGQARVGMTPVGHAAFGRAGIGNLRIGADYLIPIEPPMDPGLAIDVRLDELA